MFTVSELDIFTRFMISNSTKVETAEQRIIVTVIFIPSGLRENCIKQAIPGMISV